MNILVLNAGSSSLKWKLYEIEKMCVIASGLIEGIGEKDGVFHLTYQSMTHRTKLSITDHQSAFSTLFNTFTQKGILNINSSLLGVGHRVVHGGEKFNQPTLITADILTQLQKLNTLAPLHNPANVLGIETMMKLAPQLPNIAIFDTAFHQSMPEHAFLYALPTALYKEHKIRRYGFHGTSHHFIALEIAKALKAPLPQLNLITLHLGNGASACAIKNGKSIDTSMGFTPLEGLVMGTRSGDLDPAILTYLMREKDLTSDEIDQLLNRESGLKGLCGENDLRNIIRHVKDGDKTALLALDIFCYRIKKYIGAYIAVLGRVDAIVFSGGIGEHATLVRAKVLEGLDEAFSIEIDHSKNENCDNGAFHKEQSRIKLYVIPTDEELQIARETAELALQSLNNIN